MTLVVAISTVLSACGNDRNAVEIADSPYDPEVTVKGLDRVPDIRLGLGYRYFLRSRVGKKSLETSHQLYASGVDAHSWRSANDEQANPLEFVRIGDGRRRSYAFAASIPEETLRARRLYGYSVKFYALDGETIVMRITPEQIGAQLDAVDAVRKRLRP